MLILLCQLSRQQTPWVVCSLQFRTVVTTSTTLGYSPLSVGFSANFVTKDHRQNAIVAALGHERLLPLALGEKVLSFCLEKSCRCVWRTM